MNNTKNKLELFHKNKIIIKKLIKKLLLQWIGTLEILEAITIKSYIKN